MIAAVIGMAATRQEHGDRAGGAGLPAGEFGAAIDPVGVVAFVYGADGAGPDDEDGEREVAAVFRSHRIATLRAAPGLDVALDWLAAQPGLAQVRIGLFATGAGAAAALRAAATQPGRVAAVVSRCGCPDAASDALDGVQAPTLLIVGGADLALLDANRRAMQRLRCNKRLELVPGADRGFAEPGALTAVAHLAGAWFATHLPRGPTA